MNNFRENDPGTSPASENVSGGWIFTFCYEHGNSVVVLKGPGRMRHGLNSASTIAMAVRLTHYGAGIDPVCMLSFSYMKI